MVSQYKFVALLALLSLAACNVEETGGNTGGVGGGAGASGECPAGLAVVLSDYVSTQIALSGTDGATLSESVLSTASSQTDGLAFALSGDVKLPSARPASGELVLLDRFGTNVVTWLNPTTGKVRAQLAVGTGFESNPSDYLEVGEGVAWVTRYGQNESAGAQPHDAGGDILVLDTEAPAITGNILLPTADALPARPVAMTRLGGEVLVSLERNALDFSEMGDAMLVAYDIASGEETRRTTLTGYKSCGKAVLAPDAKRLALACTGRVSWEGVPDSLSQSALLILDATSQKLELLEAYAAEQLAGEPLQSDVAFANARLVLLKTQTPSGGATHNRWLSYELGSATAEALLEASPDAHGAGKGLVYGGMVCLPGCSNLCLMADADQGVLQRAQIRDDGRVELIAPVAVEDTVGLPPVGLGER